ncbi:MAG TPA: GreA/GreB family elongation factor [Dongiaceae bacterium]|nr:GreA/GreB family elongation factor [Dongiaceae bacterium]
MSRAFIKEADANVSAEELPERPQSPHPNYVTAGGLAALQAQLAELQEQRQRLLAHPDAILAQEHLKPVERDIRYFQDRIERAIVIDPASQPRDKVSFGAVVSTVDDDDVERRFAIVGEDEADPAKGKISWVSPLARALTGAAVGDSVVWKRPAGDKTLEVTAISY